MSIFTIATWNINSVRLRLPLLAQFLTHHKVDCLCLQETKCPETFFPHAFFEDYGFPYRSIRGEKGYNGVAILSRHPFTDLPFHNFCGKDDTRHCAGLFLFPHKTIALHNFYVPAGGYVADIREEKFAHKLAFLKEMAHFLGTLSQTSPLVLLGDLNVAPYREDVWSHKQMLTTVSHTPAETQLLASVRQTHAFIDVHRHFVPCDQKAYSWWSYRARDWRKSNRGRRLDHIWVTPSLQENVQGFTCVSQARGWERPSDHVPLLVELRGV